jgi:hypothetical protein
MLLRMTRLSDLNTRLSQILSPCSRYKAQLFITPPKYCRALECNEPNEPPVDRDGLGLIVSEPEREVEAVEADASLLANGEAVYRASRRIAT